MHAKTAVIQIAQLVSDLNTHDLSFDDTRRSETYGVLHRMRFIADQIDDRWLRDSIGATVDRATSPLVAALKRADAVIDLGDLEMMVELIDETESLHQFLDDDDDIAEVA